MYKVIAMIVMLAGAGAAYAGGLETAAASAELRGADFGAIRGLAVPLPVGAEVKQPVSPAYKNAVKKEYMRIEWQDSAISGLPVAKASELPAAAGKQLEKDNRSFPDYPSVPYKMSVQGRTVYVIRNGNDGGMFVHLFADDGSFIAGGECSESGAFGWDDGHRAAPERTEAAPRRCSREAVDQARKLLTFHFGQDDRIYIKDSVTALAPINNPANPGQLFDVLEVWGYVYKGQYRMRFYYSQDSADSCALMGQEIMEYASL